MKHLVNIVMAIAIATGWAVGAQAQTGAGGVVKFDPSLDGIIAPDAKPELLKGDYFGFTEGPTWVPDGASGYLVFTDAAANAIYEWTSDGHLSVFLAKAGFTGTNSSRVGGQSFNGRLNLIVLGPCGTTLDSEGRVVFTTFGDRSIVRVEKDGTRTVLADHYEGKRLNSPNDIVGKSDGALYFTDPPGGLREGARSPEKELPYSGVFLWKDGTLQLLDSSMAFPNGIALSPDEKYLYVNGNRKIMRYEVQPDDTITSGQVFIDMTGDPLPGGPDGMRTDQEGNIYCTGPGGVWIISPSGKHLGTIQLPVNASNFAFGDADGRTIYFTARSNLYRIRAKIPGVRPGVRY
jgi:gluconolactonase